MARGRRRPRLTRMDAAIDAMAPLGFPEQLVRKTVKELLEVYGGDGWPFIEADAYKILIDAVLEQPEEGDERNEDESPVPEREIGACGDEGSGCSTVADDPGPSFLLPSISAENRALGDERPGCSIVADDPGPSTGCSAVGEDVGSSSLSLPRDLSAVLDSIPTPPPVSCLPRRRRRPCYGWISSDESGDEPDDFIMLTPAPRLRRRNQRSRWDVRPDGIQASLNSPRV